MADVMNRPGGGRLAVVVKGYPRLSETFIAQEIHGLQKRGIPLVIVSLRHPYDPGTHPIHDQIDAPVIYLPEYLEDDRERVRRAWRTVRERPGYREAWNTFRADFARDRTDNRIRRFGQAMVMAAELPEDVSAIYVHFLHTPASVGRYGARILGLPWACSAHAKDVWTTPEWEIREKLADMEWLVTCTKINAEHLRGLADDPDKVSLLYHGIDLDRFGEVQGSGEVRTGFDPDKPVRLFSVGRVVPKKGFDDLIRVLASLPRTLHWHWTHIGGGAQLEEMKHLARGLGIADRVDWLGPQNQDVVLLGYRSSELFVLPCKIAEDGDRDGLPNVLMEAQSQALCCLSTDVSAVPELIEDGVTGVLVPPGDKMRLAEQLIRLIGSPGLRGQLGRNGAANVRNRFNHEDGIGGLADRLNRLRGADPAAVRAPGSGAAPDLTPANQP